MGDHDDDPKRDVGGLVAQHDGGVGSGRVPGHVGWGFPSAPRYRVRLIGLGSWLGGSFDPEEGGVHVQDALGAVDQGFELGQAGRVVPAQGSDGVTGVDRPLARHHAYPAFRPSRAFL